MPFIFQRGLGGFCALFVLIFFILQRNSSLQKCFRVHDKTKARRVFTLMKQTFHPAANTIAKVSIFGSIVILGAVVALINAFNRSSYITQEGMAITQPVPFSHKHHVQGLGIDCRFCHTTVDKAAFAGIPSTETCMKCHSVVWKDSPMLEPVRESFRTGKPLEWTRVHDLPDYVYFDHSIHVAKGVSCTACHGQVDQMPLTWRENTLHMSWCLSCHKNPEPSLRPKDEVFNPQWKEPANAAALRKELGQKNHVQKMTNCSVCHR